MTILTEGMDQTEEDEKNERELAAWFANKYEYLFQQTPQKYPYDSIFYKMDDILVAEVKCRKYDFDFFKREAPAVGKVKVDRILNMEVPAFFIQKCADDGVIIINLRKNKADWQGYLSNDQNKLQYFYNFDRFKIIHTGPLNAQ